MISPMTRLEPPIYKALCDEKAGAPLAGAMGSSASDAAPVTAEQVSATSSSRFGSLDNLTSTLSGTRLSVSLGPTSFPHLMELIVRNAEFTELLNLRAASREMRTMVDLHLIKHIVLVKRGDGGISVLSSNRHKIPSFRTMNSRGTLAALMGNDPLRLLRHTQVAEFDGGFDNAAYIPLIGKWNNLHTVRYVLTSPAPLPASEFPDRSPMFCQAPTVIVSANILSGLERSAIFPCFSKVPEDIADSGTYPSEVVTKYVFNMRYKPSKDCVVGNLSLHYGFGMVPNHKEIVYIFTASSWFLPLPSSDFQNLMIYISTNILSDRPKLYGRPDAPDIRHTLVLNGEFDPDNGRPPPIPKERFGAFFDIFKAGIVEQIAENYPDLVVTVYSGKEYRSIVGDTQFELYTKG